MSIPLQKIYSVFAPSPLRLDQQAMYVNLDDVRGDPGMVRGMAQKIQLSDEPTCQVLTGHRGSGKSTELGRLCKDLESPIGGEAGYFVVRVQADDELDRNDIDFPEVLIAIVRQMAAQLRERKVMELKPGYFRDRWERLKKLALSEVSFEGLDLETGMATVSTTVKNSPDARLKVREVLEPDTNNWLTVSLPLDLHPADRSGLASRTDHQAPVQRSAGGAHDQDCLTAAEVPHLQAGGAEVPRNDRCAAP